MNIKNFKNKILILGSIITLAGTSFSNSVNWNKNLQNGYNLTNVGSNWEGIGPNGEKKGSYLLKYSRIPSLIITNDNKLVAMFDLRWNGPFDQDKIDPGIAISEDGGHTWTKKTSWLFNDETDPLNITIEERHKFYPPWHKDKLIKDAHRTMDPTAIYNPATDEIFAMYGTWKTGTENWHRERENHFKYNTWATVIYKSKDNGYNFQKQITFSPKDNVNVYEKTTNDGNKIMAFLGGVGTGITMRDGTMVFPIQTSHNYQGKGGGEIGATIMYSKDEGKTWQMPETDKIAKPQQSSLENMVFEIDNKLVMTGRAGWNPRNRFAYYTEDLGKTWHEYKPLHLKIPATTQAPSQGSTIYVTLPSGRKILLVSKTKGQKDRPQDVQFERSNLTLYAADARDEKNIAEINTFKNGGGNPLGAGYSSLAYKDGKLFVAYEDADDISIKDLSNFIPKLEELAKKWNIPITREIDKKEILKLKNINDSQKSALLSEINNKNDNAIIIANVLDKNMKLLKEKVAIGDKLFSTKFYNPVKEQYTNFSIKAKEILDVNKGTNKSVNEIKELISKINTLIEYNLEEK